MFIREIFVKKVIKNNILSFTQNYCVIILFICFTVFSLIMDKGFSSKTFFFIKICFFYYRYAKFHNDGMDQYFFVFKLKMYVKINNFVKNVFEFSGMLVKKI